MTSQKVHVNISSKVFRNLQTGIDCLKYIQDNTQYNGMDLTEEEVKNIHAKLLVGTPALLDYGEQFGERMTPKND